MFSWKYDISIRDRYFKLQLELSLSNRHPNMIFKLFNTCKLRLDINIIVKADSGNLLEDELTEEIEFT